MNPYERMYNEDGSPNTNLAWDLDNPLYEASLGSYSRNGTKTFTNVTDFRWDINSQFRLTGHFNISSETGWSDIFVSPKSRTFKQETDLTKKGKYYMKKRLVILSMIGLLLGSCMKHEIPTFANSITKEQIKEIQKPFIKHAVIEDGLHPIKLSEFPTTA